MHSWENCSELQTRQRLVLRLSMPENGAVVEVPVHVLVGSSHRPRLAIVGGVHGDEYDGVVAAQRLIKEPMMELLDGTLFVIPVANPPAFAMGRRHTPMDNLDLNRCFPGRPNGSITERLAHLLFDFLRDMDF